MSAKPLKAMTHVEPGSPAAHRGFQTSEFVVKFSCFYAIPSVVPSRMLGANSSRKRIMLTSNRRLCETILWLCTCVFGASAARAADHLSAEQVRLAVAAAPSGQVDLSERDLTADDLTGFDLSGAKLVRANLSGANLHGVKLVGADLTEANLTNADLTFAWFIRANFTRANLRGATLQTIVTSTAMDNTQAEAATFAGADLSDANITVHFSFYHMRGANFSRANMTVVMANQSMGLLRTELMSSNLDGANFQGAGRVTSRSVLRSWVVQTSKGPTSVTPISPRAFACKSCRGAHKSNSFGQPGRR